ncbi:aspartyl aminopeptidase [Desulfobaculum xiamenense]|uniref:M18 family aminopeptidase n=1 Tax=Desulfobaculum xiamenense TaxID=995050 RepID=A0A846QQT7_9BACT|nr:aminopeptidase [Desulfobaculum xiamenense]NJB67755.1 aspartyl aminopeptidase [Desulfobaculum xiamenense]
MADNTLTFESRNCWEVFDGPEHATAMNDLAVRYVDFLTRCKTERETVDYVTDIVRNAGYGEDFAGDKVFRIMRGKTMFLARRGKRPLSEGFRLLGAHADAPRLDFKQHPLYEDCNIGLAKTHYYGGIRKYQWLSRPLALHGVIVRQDGEVVKVNIGEDANDPVFTVLDLLPHLAYDQVEKPLSKAFEAEKLNVVLGHAPAAKDEDDKDDKRIKKQVLTLLNAKYGIVEEDLFSAELQVVPAGPARFVGLDGSLIGSYAHDDRICVFTGLEALLTSEQPEHTQIVLFWDKEEIGSEGSTGAKSLFFEYCLEDLIDAWEPGTRLSHVLMKAKAVSADVHGGLDPDYQEVHEKLNSSLLGHGPVFCKFTGHRGKVGANDAHAEYVGWIRGVLNAAGIPWQMAELGKVDLGGGGTVAKYLAVYGMDIIDFGPSVLAMHSPFEIASKVDVYATMLAYRAFLQS